MSILLTDKHTERAVTLLALIQTAANPIEVDRYECKLRALYAAHPEADSVGDDDLRVLAKVQELRASFEPTPPVIPERSTEADETAEAFDTAADDRLGDYDDSAEYHARRDR